MKQPYFEWRTKDQIQEDERQEKKERELKIDKENNRNYRIKIFTVLLSAIAILITVLLSYD